LPVVTLPGGLMRQRHSAGILTMLGMTETTVHNVDEYVEVAARLGRDPEYRQQVSEKIARNRHKLYEDKSCIIALQEFLTKAVDVTERK
jgi:protein O-GlcNAc transferase